MIGKTKDIVVIKDGVITRHHFSNAIGATLGVKQISSTERQQINQINDQWKRNNQNYLPLFHGLKEGFTGAFWGDLSVF